MMYITEWKIKYMATQLILTGGVLLVVIMCSLVINSQYSVTSVVQSMLPVYRYLLTKNLKIWIYR